MFTISELIQAFMLAFLIVGVACLTAWFLFRN